VSATPRPAKALAPHPTAVERAFYELAFRAERDAAARAVLVKAVQGFFYAVAAERKLGGTRLLDLARTLAVRYGRWRAHRVAARLGVDADRMDSLAAIQDWEDRVFGVTGHWEVREAKRAVKCETACPFAKAAEGAPELCSDVIHALETETFRALNADYTLVPLERLLSKGHAECRFEHRIG
jgi:hypothetical protein